MYLNKFSTISLLKEIIKRGKLQQAPTKQTRTNDHKILTIGIGCDHVADLIIHDDALKELNKQ